MFAMSGDSHSEDVKIPSVFLFRKDGDILRKHAKDSIESRNLRMIVRLASARDQTSKPPNYFYPSPPSLPPSLWSRLFFLCVVF